MGTCKHPAEFRAAAFWIDGRRFDKTVHVVVTKPGVVLTGGVGRAAWPVSESIPDLPGFSLEERPLTDEWIATSDSGRFKIRGRNQAELNARRWALWSQVIANCRAAIAELFPGDR